jgi:plastocyanin
MRRFAALLAAAGLALLLAAPANAEIKTETFKYGPVEVNGYQVKLNQEFATPHPDVDGFITAMNVDVVDANGKSVPIQRIMLHHIVFGNLGQNFGDKRDQTCNSITNFDSRTQLPALAERFYGAGEERAKLQLPPGYGYQIKKGEKWFLYYMLMNHKPKKDKVYIQYNVTYDTNPDLKPVTPFWLDVRNCWVDPVYNVPGGGKKGSTDTKSMDWTVPYSGRIIAAGGHVHGGGKDLELREPQCGNRTLYKSTPTWGLPSHPFYNVRPILHEPGPINMSGINTAQGIPVAGGEKLKFLSHYDAQYVHTRVMGISVLFLARDDSVTKPCGAMPTDIKTFGPSIPGRKKTPRFIVPITAVGRDGVARSVSKAPGGTQRLRGSARVNVKDFYFSRPNVVVPQGSELTWKFFGSTLHNVTLASGPRGFASDNASQSQRYSYKFKVPGRYRLFCALHPVDMTETVTVLPKGKKK